MSCQNCAFRVSHRTERRQLTVKWKTSWTDKYVDSKPSIASILIMESGHRPHTTESTWCRHCWIQGNGNCTRLVNDFHRNKTNSVSCLTSLQELLLLLLMFLLLLLLLLLPFTATASATVHASAGAAATMTFDPNCLWSCIEQVCCLWTVFRSQSLYNVHWIVPSTELSVFSCFEVHVPMWSKYC